MMSTFPSCCSRGCIYTGIVYLAFVCVIPGIIGASLHHPSSDPIGLEGRRLVYMNNPIGGHEMSNWEEKGKPYKLEEYLKTKSFNEWLEPIGQLESPSGSSATDSDWEAGTGQTLDTKSDYNYVNFALESPMRSRRTGSDGSSSLSIVNPLDVLRKRLLMEISRRKLELDEKQRKVNAEILKNKGKK